MCDELRDGVVLVAEPDDRLRHLAHVAPPDERTERALAEVEDVDLRSEQRGRAGAPGRAVEGGGSFVEEEGEEARRSRASGSPDRRIRVLARRSRDDERGRGGRRVRLLRGWAIALGGSGEARSDAGGRAAERSSINGPAYTAARRTRPTRWPWCARSPRRPACAPRSPARPSRPSRRARRRRRAPR